MFHKKTAREVILEFKTDSDIGLSQKEVGIRLLKYGKNKLPEKPKPPVIIHFIEQFKNLLVAILLIASLISLILGDLIDALAIFTIVILNATIGFIQEVKAEKTLESLKEKAIQYSLVLRDGKIRKVPSVEIVIGDILILEEGEKIPSDGRLIEEFSLSVDESILTGESLSVQKNTQELKNDVSLADRYNMVFKDTKVVSGRGKAVIVATGSDTEIGKIATSLHETVTDKKSIIKKLPAVETLGAVRIIATDKTGTLTQNKINVVNIHLPNNEFLSVKGVGYQLTGNFIDQQGKKSNTKKNKTLIDLLTG